MRPSACFGGSNWAPNLDTPQNKKFVAAYEEAYNAVPGSYAMQAYDAALLIDSALKATGGKIDNKDAVRAAIRKADFKSLRGDFKFGTNGYPDPGLLSGEGRQASGRQIPDRDRRRRCSTIIPMPTPRNAQRRTEMHRRRPCLACGEGNACERGRARSANDDDASAASIRAQARLDERRSQVASSMTATLLFVQTLNGLQFGFMLFLIAAGLTLVFGVMDFINLAHGVQYMLGAYLAAAFSAWTGSFCSGLVLALPAALAFGLAPRSSWYSAISTTAIISIR